MRAMDLTTGRVVRVQDAAVDEVIAEYLDEDGLGMPHEWNDYLDATPEDIRADSLRVLIEDVVWKYLSAKSYNHSPADVSDA